MKELELKEIQQASLKILDQVDEICTELGLTYWLAFGTLIGAVRHKGFIPWDDDVDIIMPRESYDKFYEYMKNEYQGNLGICSRADTDHYVYGIYRVVDPAYYYESHIEHELGYDGGAFIDVYPLDYCGNKDHTPSSVFRKIDIINQFYISYMKPYAKTKWWRKPAKYIAWLYIKLFKGDEKYRYHVDDEIKKLIFDNFGADDELVGVIAWEAFFVRWRKELFEETIRLDFEGRKFMAPSGYDEILRTYYGDYMQLPPEEKRKPQHDYKLYVRE